MAACDTPLYAGVQGGSSIETKRCSGPFFPPVGCHATYLYVDEAYLYTIACPIETTTSTSTSTTEASSTRTSTATTTLRPRGELLNSSSNSTQNASANVSSEAKNRTAGLNASTRLYSASLEAETTIPAGPLDKFPAYAIVIASTCIALSCILAAVYCLMKRKQRKQRAEQLKRRRSSSVMPSVVRAPERPPRRLFKRLGPEEIQEQREKREIQKVLQKLVNTVCRFNGQYPPAPAKKKAKEPPIPPRPRHRRGQPINMRKKTLEYLRRQNPIQTALSKPLEGFTDAGRQRAKRVQAEAAKEGERQAQWSNKRRGRSRLRNIVRVKELVASKGSSKQ